VCPAYPIDDLNNFISPSAQDINHFLIGNFEAFYLAYSTKDKIRFDSSSGGTVTSLLIYALDKGIINGALVTKMSKEHPIMPEPFIAKTKEELIEAAKSKYCPVPTNIAIREILKHDGKIAVIGLPCHLKGFELAEKVNQTLKEKIVLHLGIFCSHTDTFNGIQYVLAKCNINIADIEEISYRGGGWPGGINIRLKNGVEKKVPLTTPLWMAFHDSLFFSPHCCLFFSDVTAESADISFGDPWLPEIMSTEKKGKSILIVRSERGRELLNSAVIDGEVAVSPIDLDTVITSQKTFIHFKKINLKERVQIKRLLGKNYMDYSCPVMLSPFNKVIAFIYILNYYLFSKKIVVKIFSNIPVKIIQLYLAVLFTIRHKVIEKDWRNYESDK
jgi:coenzyme F420 hydrogenase subunit beta